MSEAQDLEYFGDGIAEEIINSLTAIRDLRIIGRTSSFQFKGEKLDLREVGKKLNVANVLEGSVQRSGNKMRITVQLINTDNNSHIWSKRYDIEQTEIFKIQDSIATNIVETLNLTLSSSEKSRLIKKETSEEAYMIYLKGLFQYKKENYQEALDLFQEVVSKDSLYAPAHAYLGLSKAWSVIRSRDLTNIPRTVDAIGSAEKAIELDPTLPEGYSGRALIAWAIQRDFAKARIYFEKSLELDPGSSLIRNRYCYFLVWMGDFEKATRLSKEAMHIDPVDYNSYMILYTVSLYSNKLAEARNYHNELIKINGLNPISVSRNIELSFYEKNFGKVNQLCDSIVKADGTLDASDLSYSSMANAAMNKRNKSDEILRQLTQLQSTWNNNVNYYSARAFAFRNQTDSCFAYLTKAVDKKEIRLNQFKIDPAFKELRKDPRYIQIFKELGFDRY
jgi:TolB-like protein